MKKQNANHVTVGTGGKITCWHCGESIAMSMPAELSGWLKVSEAFTDHHRDCPAPNVAQSQQMI